MQTITRDQAYVRILRSIGQLEKVVTADSVMPVGFMTASEHAGLWIALESLKAVAAEIEKAL